MSGSEPEPDIKVANSSPHKTEDAPSEQKKKLSMHTHKHIYIYI